MMQSATRLPSKVGHAALIGALAVVAIAGLGAAMRIALRTDHTARASAATTHVRTAHVEFDLPEQAAPRAIDTSAVLPGVTGVKGSSWVVDGGDHGLGVSTMTFPSKLSMAAASSTIDHSIASLTRQLHAEVTLQDDRPVANGVARYVEMAAPNMTAYVYLAAIGEMVTSVMGWVPRGQPIPATFVFTRASLTIDGQSIG
jgi:hypothetical protein